MHCYITVFRSFFNISILDNVTFLCYMSYFPLRQLWLLCFYVFFSLLDWDFSCVLCVLNHGTITILVFGMSCLSLLEINYSCVLYVCLLLEQLLFLCFFMSCFPLWVSCCSLFLWVNYSSCVLYSLFPFGQLLLLCFVCLFPFGTVTIHVFMSFSPLGQLLFLCFRLYFISLGHLLFCRFARVFPLRCITIHVLCMCFSFREK